MTIKREDNKITRHDVSSDLHVFALIYEIVENKDFRVSVLFFRNAENSLCARLQLYFGLCFFYETSHYFCKSNTIIVSAS